MKLVKFLIGGGFVLLIKIALTFLLGLLNESFYLNYLVTHIIILLVSYIFHSNVTFRSHMNWKSFWRFTKAVIFLKMLDYLFANFGVYVFGVYFAYSILITTIIILIIRYLIMDKFVFKEQNNAKLNSKNENQVVLTSATISGNKGAESMLTSTVQNLSDKIERFILLSYYPKKDKKIIHLRNLHVLNGSPFYMLFILFPLAISYFILRKLDIPITLLEKNKEIKAIACSKASIDIAGISFADGRIVYLPYNILCVWVPLLLGKRVFKFSQAMGPFNNPINKLFAKLFLPRLSLIVARSNETEKHLKNISLKNVIKGADLAFALKIRENNKQNADRLFKKIKFKSGIVGISPSSVVEKYCKAKKINYSKIIASFIDYLIQNKNYNVIILPHSSRKGSKKRKNNDLLICTNISRRVKNKDKCTLIRDGLNSEELRHLISKCDYFVASRFHSMISSLSAKVPTLVIGWGHKYVEVLKEFELEDYCFDYRNISLKKLVIKFNELVNDRESVKRRINNNLPSLIASSSISFDKFKNLLEA